MFKLTPELEKQIKDSGKPIIKITLEEFTSNAKVLDLQEVEKLKKNYLKKVNRLG
jgi:hypothetical protein